MADGLFVAGNEEDGRVSAKAEKVKWPRSSTKGAGFGRMADQRWTIVEWGTLQETTARTQEGEGMVPAQGGKQRMDTDFVGQVKVEGRGELSEWSGLQGWRAGLKVSMWGLSERYLWPE